jgi:hypothetical protein
MPTSLHFLVNSENARTARCLASTALLRCIAVQTGDPFPVSYPDKFVPRMSLRAYAGASQFAYGAPYLTRTVRVLAFATDRELVLGEYDQADLYNAYGTNKVLTFFCRGSVYRLSFITPTTFSLQSTSNAGFAWNSLNATVPLTVLPAAQMWNWCEADVGVSTTASGVSNWEDRRNKQSMTQAATGGPTFVGAGITWTDGSNKSRPLLAFDGVAGRLLKCVGPGSSGVTALTVAAVVKMTRKAGGVQTVFSSSGWGAAAGSVQLYAAANASALQLGAWGGTWSASSSFAFADGVPFVVVVSATVNADGTLTGASYYNGTADGSTAVSAAGAVTSLHAAALELGGWSGDAQRTLNGGVSAFVAYNATLAAAERQRLEGYLAWRWLGSGAALPAAHPYRTASPIAPVTLIELTTTSPFVAVPTATDPVVLGGGSYYVELPYKISDGPRLETEFVLLSNPQNNAFLEGNTMRLMPDYRDSSYEITVMGTSRIFRELTATWTMRVKEVGVPALVVVGAIPGFTNLTNVTQTVNLSQYFSDPAGRPIQYSVIDNPQNSASIPAGTSTLTIVPMYRGISAPGYVVKVRAIGTDGRTADNTLTVTEVSAPYRITVYGGSLIQLKSLDSMYSINPYPLTLVNRVVDDLGPVTYSVVSNPNKNAYVDGNTLYIAINYRGSTAYDIIVRGSGLYGTYADLTVRVTETTGPQIYADPIPAIVGLSNDVRTVALYSYFRDSISSTPLTYAVTTNPVSSAVIASDGVTLTVTGAYRGSTYTVGVTATGSYNRYIANTVSVTEVGVAALTKSSIPSLTGLRNTAVQLALSGYFSDPLNGALTYSVVEDPEGCASIISSSKLQILPAYRNKTYTVKVRASGTYARSIDNTVSVRETAAPLFAFASFTFGTAGRTGRWGASLAEFQSAYGAQTAWVSSYFTTLRDGVQVWSVPTEGSYKLTVAGARGGGSQRYVNNGSIPGYTLGPLSAMPSAGGGGRVVSGTVALAAGDKLIFVVGQCGQDKPYMGGGGGGTFVYLNAVSSTGLLLVGGGGGGASVTGDGDPGKTTSDGGSGVWVGTYENSIVNSYITRAGGGGGTSGGGGGGGAGEVAAWSGGGGGTDTGVGGTGASAIWSQSGGGGGGGGFASSLSATNAFIGGDRGINTLNPTAPSGTHPGSDNSGGFGGFGGGGGSGCGSGGDLSRGMYDLPGGGGGGGGGYSGGGGGGAAIYYRLYGDPGGGGGSYGKAGTVTSFASAGVNNGDGYVTVQLL